MICNVWGRRLWSLRIVKGNRFYLPSGQMFLQSTCRKKSNKPPGSWGVGHLGEYSYPGNREEPRALYIAKPPYRFLILAHWKQGKVLVMLEEDGMFRQVTPTSSEHSTTRGTALRISTCSDMQNNHEKPGCRFTACSLPHGNCWANSPTPRYRAAGYPAFTQGCVTLLLTQHVRVVSTGQPARYLYLAFGNFLCSERQDL